MGKQKRKSLILSEGIGEGSADEVTLTLGHEGGIGNSLVQAFSNFGRHTSPGELIKHRLLSPISVFLIQ